MYGKAAGKLTLAEDSGIEVDALGGMPGVQTARFSKTDTTAPYAALIRAMKNVPEGERTAQFHSTVVIYDPTSDKVRSVHGINSGRVAIEPKGDRGFGHDPVFYYDNGEKTGAEISEDDKNMISHRGRAMKKAREVLLAEFV
jgi:XTP/dITP diphosphohydrolase